MVAQLTEYFTYIIEQMGYWGAAFLMALESMIAPVPSELVMPFVGFLAADGKFSIPMAIVFTSIGSLVGSLISYYLGLWGGRPLVLKAGRYLFLNHEHLEWTERWFAKNGSWTIFVSRFIPVVRHLISIPAGLGRMNVWRFSIFTHEKAVTQLRWWATLTKKHVPMQSSSWFLGCDQDFLRIQKTDL